ncbi:MAG: amino acid ABC transporter permease [Proteobacteria bacterium]|nr:amino acid ABC transporter permease [Pseudomonadota bacterium]
MNLVNWTRKNLFSNWHDTLLTFIIVFLFYISIPPLLNWMFFDATFFGTSKKDCSGTGACWVFIQVWLKRFTYGMYPNDQIWRIDLAFIIFFFVIGAYFFVNTKIKKILFIFLTIIFPFLAIFLFHGGLFGLEEVETRVWGGLFLTLFISVFSIIFCFPIGVLLAMGRRSKLPVIRYFSIGFIELWRGVPLITVLFMAAVMFPVFLPSGTNLDKLVRVIIAITLFESAYIAEVIRGGLQAIPKGQYDAANSLGMGYWKSHILIILPQALKIVIPGVANTFIALFKDTPLILVVGLMELLGMVNMAKTNPAWLGLATEGYVFASIVYFIFCFAMSRYSLRLEKQLKTSN